MAVVIGSARSSYGNTAAGDQRQTASADYAGEVSMQEFYIHSKGWMVHRPKSDAVAAGLARAMIRACNNKNIGYSQPDRYSCLKYGTAASVKCNTDCSCLVRICIKEAAGKDLGDFYTGNESAVLDKSGLFEPGVKYTSGMTLKTGDVLCTLSKGHTVIVVSGASRGSVVQSTTTKKTATADAAKKDSSLAGVWYTSDSCHIRNDAGKEAKSMGVLKQGTLVRNYGFYSTPKGSSTRWLYVVAILNGVEYIGFVSEKCLIR